MDPADSDMRGMLVKKATVCLEFGVGWWRYDGGGGGYEMRAKVSSMMHAWIDPGKSWKGAHQLSGHADGNNAAGGVTRQCSGWVGYGRQPRTQQGTA